MTMTRPTTEQITHNGQILKDVLGPIVNPLTFGAVGDGVADDTAALKAAFDYAMPLKLPVLLRGRYMVSGPITSLVTTANYELHIICDGHVSIAVDPGAATTFGLFYILDLTAAPNVSITGGSLTVDCADRIANCFWFQHTAATGGTVAVTCPVSISNCRLHSGSGGNASGFFVSGRWNRIEINDATVVNVTRATSSGVCRGINVEVGATGEATIRRPYLKNILLPTPSNTNADGIGVSGEAAAGDAFNDNRLGRVVIEGGTFIDCQGQAVKSQCSDTTIISPYIKRKNYVGFAGGADLEIQFGGGTIISPTFEYLDNAGTSPLVSDFSAIRVAYRNPQFPTASTVTNATVIADVPMRRFFDCQYVANQKPPATTIDGVTLVPASGYAGAIINREIVRFSGENNLLTMTGTASIVVRNVRGPMDAAGIAYGTFTGGAIASKLSVEVVNVHNTLGQGTFTAAFTSLSGTQITELDSFVFRNNVGITAFISSPSNSLRNFDFAKLAVGNVFSVPLSYLGTVTNAPPWETGGDRNALVEVLVESSSAFLAAKTIRVTVSGGTTNRPQQFISIDNATTWREIGGCTPVTKTGDFTVAGAEDVLICNKSGSACVVTLPAAATWSGRKITIKTIQAQAVTSASSNVVPLAGGAAGTAILTGTAGKYADLVSDGTNWVIMAAN